jgi:phosphinothricin acetyltransferase
MRSAGCVPADVEGISLAFRQSAAASWDRALFRVQTNGLGLGAALLRALAESTEGDGIWTIQASVFPENEASLKLHLANGYVVVGRRHRIAKMTHGPLSGQWRDTVLIERRSPAD